MKSIFTTSHLLFSAWMAKVQQLFLSLPYLESRVENKNKWICSLYCKTCIYYFCHKTWIGTIWKWRIRVNIYSRNFFFPDLWYNISHSNSNQIISYQNLLPPHNLAVKFKSYPSIHQDRGPHCPEGSGAWGSCASTLILWLLLFFE